jgi:hypothetical protein
VRLALDQPSLRREWTLRLGAEVAATLWLPLFRRGGAADLGGRASTIERAGGLRADWVLRDRTTQEERLHLKRQDGKRVVELGDRVLEWKKLGWTKGYGFVGPDEEPVLRGKVSTGILKTKGELEVEDELPEEDALLLALLASFLLIRKAEDDSSAAGSTAVVISSS